MKKGTEDAVISSAQGVALSNKGPKTTHVNNADLWTLEDVMPSFSSIGKTLG